MDYCTLSNSNGIELEVARFGGIIKKLMVPDRYGDVADIVLGFDELEDYQDRSPYFGALVGRYGNRIAKGRFTLDGEVYSLAVNDGVNHLHGGLIGFDKVLWEAEEFSESGESGVRLSYRSADGEEGYPGELNVVVTYSLSNTDDLTIIYRAKTSKPTHVNLTQHAYFNLAGHNCGEILDHEIWINADFFTPTDEGFIPTGEIRTVQDTVFDFRTSKRIDSGIHADDEQLKLTDGFDHNFVLKKLPYDLSHAATATDTKSGRSMEVLTTEPGVQFYTGNYLDGIKGKGGAFYKKQHGFCLETQHFPDTPNKSMFPSTRLDPGQEYVSQTVYKFGIE